MLAALHARGFGRVFVEGGGATVSCFLDAGVLDRLQVAVAPLVIGHGRPGIELPPHERLADSLRLVARVYAMGRDVLFDCDLRAREEPDYGVLRRLV
jgi:diaminohydroxyphosphoribosylaminopyrimidine deaminase/5-amino-6-(5-phosphoribosylamino)uracil reductase